MKKGLFKLISILSISALLLSSCVGEGISSSNNSGDKSQSVSQAGNGDKNNSETSKENTNSDNSSDTGTYEELSYKVSYKETDLETNFDETASVSIKCEGTSVTINGTGATSEGGIITITNSGIYALEGKLDGRIIVNSTDSDPVRLILKGISVTCDTSAPIYVSSADKVIVTLEENTENFFKDSATYVYDDETNEEPSAAIFSKDDLTFNGNGTLTVEATFKNGIGCKDKLKICGGIIKVTAKNDGIKGKDCVGIRGGEITIKSGGDGIQSSNTSAGNVGFVNIENGTVTINSSLDGIQGENGVCISGGKITVNSGNSYSTESQKGIKGTKDITITGGVINVTSSDDALHSDGKINVEGGDITVSSDDDGFHAESEINIKDGNVNVIRSYEGFEAAKINIKGGNTRIKASDDGVNASDGSGGKGGFGGFGGGMADNSNCAFNVSGGYIYVNAQGDGLDSNGSISISDGIAICEGPTSGGNSSVDHNGSISITGGMLLSFGSSGMASECLSEATSSTQCAFDSYISGNAGTTIAIKTSSGEILCVFKTSKQFGHLVFSSPELKTGETYEIWTGGTGSGECTDGLYKEKTYNGGTSVATITQSSTITTSGGGMGGMGGGFPGGGFPGGSRPSKPGRW